MLNGRHLITGKYFNYEEKKRRNSIIKCAMMDDKRSPIYFNSVTSTTPSIKTYDYYKSIE